jgi:Flp pilus assembly protein TadG
MPRRIAGLGSAPAKSLKDESGAVAVEFALLAPFLLLIMLAVVTFALQFSILTAVIHAASEGARASISGSTDADRASAAQQRVQDIFQSYGSLLSASNVTVTTAAGIIPNTYAVKVDYDTKGIDVTVFYQFWQWVTGVNQTAPKISYTATVANGGY